ncbi:MAG: hypothetical protein NC120_13445, partial [Ruminococcus sp.]|nr:hypothetical protein [Ruminococcus sp.]
DKGDSIYISGEYKSTQRSHTAYKIFDINDNYYILMQDGSVSKFSNIYTLERDDILFVAPMTGADVYNNALYYKDKNNNVYRADVENLTEEVFISVDDIFQNGKQFIGNDKCSGLYMTNDGGFVTLDTSDGKIKYIAPPLADRGK